MILQTSKEIRKNKLYTIIKLWICSVGQTFHKIYGQNSVMFRYILLAVLTVITNMTKYHYLTLCSWLLLVGRSDISWEIDARTYTHTLRKKTASVVWWIIYVLVKDTISVHSCLSIWIGSSNLSLKSKCIHHTTYLLVLCHSNVPGLLNWIWHLQSLDLQLIC